MNHFTGNWKLSLTNIIRTFRGRENRSAAIINQAFANKYWPGEDALGKRVRMIRTPGDLRSAVIAQPLLTVVGIVPDVKQNWDPNVPLEPVMYVPFRQGQSARAMAVLARPLGGDPLSLIPQVRGAVQNANSAIPLIDPMTLAESFAQRRWFQRVFSIIFAIFGAIGFFLAIVGIYGVLSYSVSQRTQEVGIRIALGGQRGRILKLVVGHAVRLTLLGVGIGLAAICSHAGDDQLPYWCRCDRHSDVHSRCFFVDRRRHTRKLPAGPTGSARSG